MDEEQLTAAHKQLLKLHEQSLHALETAEKRNEATAKLLAEVKGEREQINKVHEEIASMLRNADAAVPPRAKAREFSPGLSRFSSYAMLPCSSSKVGVAERCALVIGAPGVSACGTFSKGLHLQLAWERSQGWGHLPH